MTAFIASNLLPFLAAILIIWIVYNLSRRHHDEKLAASLYDALNNTQTLFNKPISNDYKIETWECDINDHIKWMRREINGKITQAELTALLTPSSGISLHFSGGKPQAEMNDLHYLEERIRKLIDKYS